MHTGRIVPVYRLTEGLKEGQVRRFLHTAIGVRGEATPVVGGSKSSPAETRARRPAADRRSQCTSPTRRAALRRAARWASRSCSCSQPRSASAGRAGRRTPRHPCSAPPTPRWPPGWTRAPVRASPARRRVRPDPRRPRAERADVAAWRATSARGKTVVAALRIAVASSTQAALMAPTDSSRSSTAARSPLWAAGGPPWSSSRRAWARQRRSGGSRRNARRRRRHARSSRRACSTGFGLSVVDEQHRFGRPAARDVPEKGTRPAPPAHDRERRSAEHALSHLPRPRHLDHRREPAGRRPIRTAVRAPEALPKVWPWLPRAGGRGRAGVRGLPAHRGRRR